MSLTTGRGPLGRRPAGVFSVPMPDGVVYVEPYPRRVRGVLGDATVVDSERVVLVHRPDALSTYGFPAADVSGVASTPLAEAPGFVTVAWDAVDTWFEEDHEVVSHPRSPYHRIDILPTHRHLLVTHGAHTVVDTTDTLVLYETGLAPRLYVAPEHVLPGMLERSDTVTYCPYKGEATHWSARVGDDLVADAAWSYEDPLDESLAIAGRLSFYNDKLTVSTDLPPPVDLRG